MAQFIDLPSVYEGTTWDGLGLTIQMPAGTPLPLAGAEIKMTYRRAGERKERLVLSLGAGIEITNAPLGMCKVSKQVLPLAVGNYNWEIIIRLQSGEVKPLLVGRQNITRVGLSA